MQSKIQARRFVQRQAFMRRAMSYAAAVVLLFTLAGGAWLAHNQEVVVTNGLADNQELTLPDGSELVLKQGAELRYKKSLFTGFSRHVALNGEAFFHVKKMGDARKFSVATPSSTVTVLGTQFNVRSQAQETLVSLSEGKVKLSSPSGNFAPHVMKPGEMAISQLNVQALQIREMNPKIFGAWTQKRLELDHFTMGEMAELMDYQFGLKLVFEKPATKDKHIYGTAPSGEPELLIKALEEIMKQKFVQRNDTIFIN